MDTREAITKGWTLFKVFSHCSGNTRFVWYALISSQLCPDSPCGLEQFIASWASLHDVRMSVTGIGAIILLVCLPWGPSAPSIHRLAEPRSRWHLDQAHLRFPHCFPSLPRQSSNWAADHGCASQRLRSVLCSTSPWLPHSFYKLN